VREDWRLPSEGGVQVVVKWRAGHPLRPTDDMCNLHKMVVYNIREVVCGRSVRLHQNCIGGVKRTFVVSGGTGSGTTLQAFDVTIDQVRICALVDILGLLETDCRNVRAVLVASRCDKGSCPRSSSLRSAETAIRGALVQQILCMFLVESIAFRLPIWAIGTANPRTFVPLETRPLQVFT
jgi:hypothetical protein